ncbi:MAG: chromate transporter [Eubacterium sp.]|nr:chromate transporter [Candidatus Colimonas fimequi]
MTSLPLTLGFEFFKIGLFAIGGGPATLPFLMDLTKTHDWYTMSDLTNMVAVSEATPGPLGLNMATFAGVEAMGIWGGLVASIGLVIPSVIIITLIAKFLEGFNDNPIVKSAMFGIKPAVTGIIAAAVLNLFIVSLYIDGKFIVPSAIIAVVIFVCLQIKKFAKIHPFFWFAAAAAVGIVFKL